MNDRRTLKKYAIQILNLFLTFIVIVFFLPCTAEAIELSFGKALEIMHIKNESLQAARMEKKQRMYEKSAARGLYFPKLTANSRYTRINDPITIDLNDIRTAMLTLHPAVQPEMIPPFELSVQDDRFWRVSANLTWPVFTGGRILAANRAADARVKESKEKLRYTESILISELANRYFGLCLAQDVVKVRQQVLDGMDAHLFQARKLEENGMIARSERLHAEVTRAEAYRHIKRAVRNADIARTALNNTISSDEPIEPTSPLFLLRYIEPLPVFRKMAVSRNPILKQIIAKQELAHQGYKKELGSFYPEIYLFGMRELYKHDLTLLDPEWAVGIGANLTLFDGLSRSNRVKAAKKMEKRISCLKQKAIRDIETLVEKRYQELMKAMEQFEAIQASFEFAEEYLRVRTRAFEEGLATSLDVVDAELSLSRVKIERLTAVFEFDVTLAGLLEACGNSEQFEAYQTGAHMEVEF